MTPIKTFGLMLAAFIVVTGAPLLFQVAFIAGVVLVFKDYVIKKYPV